MGRIRDYKGELLTQLRMVGIPQPETEVVFAPPRKWRFDFCWTDPELMIAIEYQGGNYYGKSGHNTVAGLSRDYEKFTEAAIRGWMLILVDAATVRSGQALDWIVRAFNARKV